MNKSLIREHLGIIIGLFIVGLLFAFLPFKQVPQAIGSVDQGGEYQSTTTDSVDASATVSWVVKSGSGTFGSFTITNTSGGAGPIRFWDATSTATSTYQNENNLATSTTYGRLLAVVKATSTEETFTFDAVVFKGLVVEVPVGYTGNGVITYR